MFRKFVVLLIMFIVAGCAGSGGVKTNLAEGVKAFAFVDGKVVEVAGDMFTVQVDLNLLKDNMNFNQRVAAKITEEAFLLENMKTRINGKEATVAEKRGSLYVFTGRIKGLKSGQIVKIFVPKKTLAVSSFKALKYNKDEGELWLENLTTEMVNTGQFNVVERSKLGAIMDELKLELSGLTNSEQASKVGKLLNADIILTGSMADMGGYWDANLRLVNTATSVILIAIKDKVTYAEFKPDSLRDSSPLNATFENGQDGFNVGFMEKEKASRNVYIDDIGANGTSKSIRLDFEMFKRSGRIAISNGKDRDLSRYSGAKFYAKATKPINIKFVLQDENRDDAHSIDNFQTDIRLGTSWKSYKVPFSSLRYMKDKRGKPRGLITGDTVLSLDMIRYINFVYSPKISPKVNGKKVMEGSYWIDEISFY